MMIICHSSGGKAGDMETCRVATAGERLRFRARLEAVEKGSTAGWCWICGCLRYSRRVDAVNSEAGQFAGEASAVGGQGRAGGRGVTWGRWWPAGTMVGKAWQGLESEDMGMPCRGPSMANVETPAQMSVWSRTIRSVLSLVETILYDNNIRCNWSQLPRKLGRRGCDWADGACLIIGQTGLSLSPRAGQVMA